ncbi:ArsC family reductase [Sphingomonas sp. LY29]|uniref:ArsC family reductase n=1 Tax=unclassified Sphingomonas TaxID=196159 RepID=UPI002ADEF85B|nr:MULTISPECIES: ArsC family reductase [unclassified Sphingomonas]MEA1071942.1 ArsC family reductase [Sphingomonas sp. LY160]WRP25371.1 ArsC family reductase [Sphingomonas sp. LY29]
MVTLYGIPNCDTVKKARAWLESRGVNYGFHDYKKAGADAALLQPWVDRLGWEALLNRSGTTFRKMDESERSNIDESKAIAMMSAQPSLIRRPVLVADDALLVGFKASAYEDAGLG